MMVSNKPHYLGNIPHGQTDQATKARLLQINLETLHPLSEDYMLAASYQAVEACEYARPGIQLTMTFDGYDIDFVGEFDGRVERFTVDFGDLLYLPTCDLVNELTLEILSYFLIEQSVGGHHSINE